MDNPNIPALRRPYPSLIKPSSNRDMFPLWSPTEDLLFFLEYVFPKEDRTLVLVLQVLCETGSDDHHFIMALGFRSMCHSMHRVLPSEAAKGAFIPPNAAVVFCRATRISEGAGSTMGTLKGDSRPPDGRRPEKRPKLTFNGLVFSRLFSG